jgi:hypothetical protein
MRWQPSKPPALLPSRATWWPVRMGACRLCAWQLQGCASCSATAAHRPPNCSRAAQSSVLLPATHLVGALGALDDQAAQLAGCVEGNVDEQLLVRVALQVQPVVFPVPLQPGEQERRRWVLAGEVQGDARCYGGGGTTGWAAHLLQRILDCVPGLLVQALDRRPVYGLVQVCCCHGCRRVKEDRGGGGRRRPAVGVKSWNRSKVSTQNVAMACERHSRFKQASGAPAIDVSTTDVCFKGGRVAICRTNIGLQRLR